MGGGAWVVGGEKEDENGENEPEGAEYEVDEAHQALPISERRKQKRLEVFVGGLDKETTEDDLTSVFKKVGDVVEVRLMKNPQTGKNKGYAFIRYATAALAKRAAQELERVEVSSSCRLPPTFLRFLLRILSSCQFATQIQCFVHPLHAQLCPLLEPHSFLFTHCAIPFASSCVFSTFHYSLCRFAVVLVVYCQVKRMIHYSLVILASHGRKKL